MIVVSATGLGGSAAPARLNVARAVPRPVVGFPRRPGAGRSPFEHPTASVTEDAAMFGRRKKKSRLPAEGLVVGEQDAMHGTLRAEVVTVSGRVDGALEVTTNLVVTPTGCVTGTMSAARLVIEPGAVVRAVCRVGLPADAGETGLPAVSPGVLRLTPRSTRAVGAPASGSGSAAAGG
jgi:hypothetical protein